MGWHMSAQRRECRQASIQSPAQGCPPAQNHAVQCAWAAVKKKDSYLQAQFYRIRARRGPKKAIIAVVASTLTAIYHMLNDGTMYQDLGRDH
jgi:transposase